MIQFEDVSKKYGDVTALLGVSFTIEAGQFVFLVGPTGSGKTTIFRLLMRDILPTTGRIIVDEWDLVKLPGSKIPQLRRKIGVVFQDLKLLMDRTVIENVMLPLQIAGVSEKEARRRASDLLSDVGLADKYTKFPLQLSGGERQRVAIARALIFEPPVILADEPTGNLDLDTSLQILDLLESINRARGTTIFMATHNSEIIGRTHHRVITMKNGSLNEDKKAQEKSTKPDPTTMLRTGARSEKDESEKKEKKE